MHYDEPVLFTRHSLRANPVTVYKGAISLMAFTILGDNDSNKNPNWSALGYDGPDISPKSVTEEYMYTMINSTVIKDCTLEYDVVVVGSGCGGMLMPPQNTRILYLNMIA